VQAPSADLISDDDVATSLCLAKANARKNTLLQDTRHSAVAASKRTPKNPDIRKSGVRFLDGPQSILVPPEIDACPSADLPQKDHVHEHPTIDEDVEQVIASAPAERKGPLQPSVDNFSEICSKFAQQHFNPVPLNFLAPDFDKQIQNRVTSVIGDWKEAVSTSELFLSLTSTWLNKSPK
jgi:hypothetical protein